MRRELVAQVREQVNSQIGEHLPVPLEEQAKESRSQLIEVKHALMNSYVKLPVVYLVCHAYLLRHVSYFHYTCISYRESRRANSNLRTDNLTDQLAVVLKPDGTRSDVYPHNLHSLFAYSGASRFVVPVLTAQR